MIRQLCIQHTIICVEKKKKNTSACVHTNNFWKDAQRINDVGCLHGAGRRDNFLLTCSKSKDKNNFLTTKNEKESVDFQTELER